jgi:hypothetical protein
MTTPKTPKTKAENGSANGNRIAGLVEEKDKKAKATEDTKKPDEAKKPKKKENDEDKEPKHKKAAEAEMNAARAELHKELKNRVVPTFEHGTLAAYANMNGRDIMMKKEQKGDRGLGYKIDPICTTAMSFSIDQARILPNDYVLTDDKGEGRQASFLGCNFIHGPATLYRNATFDVNQAEINARIQITRKHGHADDDAVASTVESWLQNRAATATRPAVVAPRRPSCCLSTTVSPGTSPAPSSAPSRATRNTP